MTLFTLRAEREGSADRTILAPEPLQFASLRAAAIYVEAREQAGTWPEGHDAIAVLDDGRRFLYEGDRFPEWVEL